jgi:hypothetical protein
MVRKKRKETIVTVLNVIKHEEITQWDIVESGGKQHRQRRNLMCCHFIMHCMFVNIELLP